MATFGVTTKYHGATNHRGSRIKVTSHNESAFVSYSYADNNAHEAAVREVYGQDAAITYVCPSESGRGDVYSVTIGE